MSEKLRIGWVGLGDQGAPMARAVSEEGFELHVWARRRSSFNALEGVAFVPHQTVADLGAHSEIVALCLSEDKDNLSLMVAGGLLGAMPAGSVLVNHGTGLPAVALETVELAHLYDVDAIDAPVSGGHSGAVAKQLTTIVGGDAAVVAKVRPVFESFSSVVAHMGGAGSGQTGKLINNAMLMLNQKNIADLLDVAQRLNVDIAPLVGVLRAGTASSRALLVLGSAVTPENADHLSRLQLIDMDLFAEAVAALGVIASDVTQRAIEGANALPALARLVTV